MLERDLRLCIGRRQAWFGHTFVVAQTAQSADDVIADVFLVAWRRLEEVPADPLPWLLGVARRTLANRCRSAVIWR